MLVETARVAAETLNLSPSDVARITRHNTLRLFGLPDPDPPQIAYAIGVAEPVSVMIDLMHTGVVPKERVEEIVREVFDLRPQAIIEYLDLLRPIYRNTAAYGHFGRSEPEFSWEQTNQADIMREKAGL